MTACAGVWLVRAPPNFCYAAGGQACHAVVPGIRVSPMSYQVLARKWRPKTFAEMVGQEHVVRALSNALDHDRLHHAYLFTGTRGVGKTTLARILSKSLNCETGVGSTPCGVCSICREVDEGRFIDLLEVDAASKTGVDDTRDLLDNVPYAPVRGRYKVYLIDEVHMFSTSSFNALLKTLEEPPPHVKFLLATTDPQKVPATVLSRCLQFNLKRLTVEQIHAQFDTILAAEGVAAQPEGLAILARAADGSMRDGLSLLDQAIAFGGGSVAADAVRDMLGVVASDQLPDIIVAVQHSDGAAVLAMVDGLAERAPDFGGLLRDLLALLHRVALVQAVPDAVQASWGDVTRIRELATVLSPEDTQLYYQIALIGQRDLPLAPDARSGFEMVLLRMLAFRPDGSVDDSDRGGGRPRSATTAPLAAPATSRPSPGAPVSTTPVPPPTPTPAASPPTSAPGGELGDWHQLCARLELKGLAAQLAGNCTLGAWDGHTLTLNLDPGFATLKDTLAQTRLHDALAGYLGKGLQLVLETGLQTSDETPAQRLARTQAERQQRASQDIAGDPLVLAIQDTFDAEVVDGSIHLTDARS